ncbi:CD166 antigen homolog isoform 2-T3 [Menidia menidia]
MDRALLLLAALSGTLSGTLGGAWGTNVTAWYGETIVVPCQGEAPVPQDLVFIKWTYKKDDGTSGDLLIKQARKDQATVQATDDYAQRVSINDKLSLLITQASMKDQKAFSCMVVSTQKHQENTVYVRVHKKPSALRILDQAEVLRKDALITVGTCVVPDANPAANVTWQKRGDPLIADGKAVVIAQSVKVDPATGLSTSTSTLQYSAAREDVDAVFRCVSTYGMSHQQAPLGPFPVHYLSETVSLQILPKGAIVEGDNVTLSCLADGNPPPRSFLFHIQAKKLVVENSNSYTLAFINREASGEYSCSLAEREELKASQNLTVNYIDLSLSPTGRILKKVNDSLSVMMELNTTGDATVSWAKNGKAVTKPEFIMLTYADAGVYVCQVSLAGLVRNESFELVVEGKPVITNLTKHDADEGGNKVLTCEAEGVPAPEFQWNTEPIAEEISYSNGKVINKVTVAPRSNLNVTCSVSNKLGKDIRTINISSGYLKLLCDDAVQSTADLSRVCRTSSQTDGWDRLQPPWEEKAL